MNTVLMVAYHYPPEGSSSGVQRTLTFSRYLREYGWRPVVLTASPRAYTVVRSEQMADIPEDVVVRRAFALDSARHLALAGRYAGFTALPDRWVSWWPGATLSGLRLIRRYRPRVIWSTFPIATTHAVAGGLARLSRLPWIADFRDSMTEDGYPPDETKRKVYRWIERNTMRSCTRAVFTAPSAARMYAERYPDVPPNHLIVLPNGYDEDSFQRAEREVPGEARRDARAQLVLLHSGSLYPSERDPRRFFDAVARLASEGVIDAKTLRIVLRATGHDEHHRQLIAERGIESIVHLEPPIPYHRALREMLDVDGLLLFQASNCNHQVPAKVYEYFRSGRPILALTDPVGDTARVLNDAGVGSIAPLDDAQAIASSMRSLIDDIRAGTAKVAKREEVERHSRRARTRALATMLDDVAEGATD